MSTISLRFGVHTRNWPRSDFQPLEFNFEFYFWRVRGGGRFAEFQQRVSVFAEFQQRVRYIVSISSSNLFRITKKSFKIIILTDVRFISLKKPTKMH